MTMQNAMISQPMNGKTDEEIAMQHERAVRILETKGYKVINTLFTDEWHEKEKCDAAVLPLHFLARAIEKMSRCRAVYFCKGWGNARGCRIEHAVAEAYGLDILYEE